MILKSCKVDVSHVLNSSSQNEYGLSGIVDSFYVELGPRTRYIMIPNKTAIENALNGGRNANTLLFILYNDGMTGITFTELNKEVEAAFVKDSQQLFPEEERPNFFDVNENPEKYTKEQLVDFAVRAGFALMALEERYITHNPTIVDERKPAKSTNTKKSFIAAKPTMEAAISDTPIPEYLRDPGVNFSELL